MMAQSTVEEKSSFLTNRARINYCSYFVFKLIRQEIFFIIVVVSDTIGAHFSGIFSLLCDFSLQ